MKPLRRRARHIRSLGATLSAAALIAGCGVFSADNREPPAPLTELEPSARITTVWQHDVGAALGRRFLKLRPAVSGSRVFAAGRGGDVGAYDLASGDRLWEHDTGASISAGPGVGDGLVLVGTDNAEVIALDEEDGEERWRRRVSSEVLAAPSAAAGVAIVRTQDGKLIGLAANDGARLWVYDRAVPALSLRGTSTPVIAGASTVVAGFDSGLLVAVALSDGQLLWESRIAVASGRSELERLVDIDADPIVLGGTIYVVTYQGRVAAVDLRTGNLVWRREMSSHAGLGVASRYLYVTDEQSLVWALDRDTSASVWRQDELERRALTPPVAFGEYVVVGDFEGYLHVLDRDDGRIAARARIDGDGLSSAPVATDDLLLVYGRGGTLSALRVE